MAGRIAMDLARSNAVVVSGMAEGIDAAALKGALQGGGRVISVLAGGVDVIYPACNRWLDEDIQTAGALISENPPGTRPEGWRFPIRNRIISGLSLGVLVVEAAERSGALITVEEAEARLAPQPGRTKREAQPEQPEKEALPEISSDELARLGDEQREVLFLLAGSKLTADDIVGRTDIPARRVNTALTILQAQGYLKELPGRRFTAAVRFDQDR